MAPLLLLAFIGIPLIEIAVLLQVGGWLGLWPTLGLIILTAIIGSMELRAQGLATIAKLRAQMDRGELPAQTLFDGVCLLFAGALLLTPGFVTDIVGMALFLPPVRRVLRVTVGRALMERAEVHVYRQGGSAGAHGGGPRGRGTGRGPDDVVDADYTDVTHEEPDETAAGTPGDDPHRRIPR
jgi:UPF0716 protein FxsA